MGGGGMDPQDLFSQLFGGGGGFFGGGGGSASLFASLSSRCSWLTSQAHVRKDHERARTSYTESLFPSKTCTRVKSKSSPSRNQSFVKDAKVEAVKRERSLPVLHVEDKVSKSCSVNSVRWSNRSNNHVTNVRVQER